MERLETYDMDDLGKDLKVLLFRHLWPIPKRRGEKVQRTCAVCFSGGNSAYCTVSALSEGFSDEVIQVLLMSLLVPKFDDLAESLGSRRVLWLCRECNESLSKLVELFFKLEELRHDFNILRRRVGREVIVTSLGKGDDVFERWKEEVRKVEDVFPSCASKRNNSAVLAADAVIPYLDEEVEVKLEEDVEVVAVETDKPLTRWEDDVKLSQKPLVVLERLPSEETKVEVIHLDSDEDEIFDEPVGNLDLSDESRDTHEEPPNQPGQPGIKPTLNVWDEDFETQWIPEEEIYRTETFGRSLTRSDEHLSQDVQKNRRKSHRYSSSRGKRLECPNCSMSFNLQIQLVVHRRVAHGIGNCSSSKVTSTRKEMLKDHRESIYGEAWLSDLGRSSIVCDVCDSEFANMEECLRHKVKDHGLCFKEIRCTHCDVTFLDPLALTAHVLTGHFLGSTGEGHLQCRFCLKLFGSLGSLQFHQSQYHSHTQGQQPSEGQSPNRAVKNIRCFVCKTSTSYSSVEELKKHKASSEHQAALRPKALVYCNVCKMNFKGSLEALEVHLTSQEHLREAEALKDIDLSSFCVPCRKRFEGLDTLEVHTRTKAHHDVCAFRHGGEVIEAPLEITAQSSSIPNTIDLQSDLESGVLKSHNPSDYSCQHCSVKFTNRLDLYNHRASHCDRNTKTHMCLKCEKTFKTLELLHSHVRHQHEHTPTPTLYVCDFCRKAFGSQRHLRNHFLSCRDGVF